MDQKKYNVVYYIPENGFQKRRSGIYLGTKPVYLKPDRNLLSDELYNSIKDLPYFVKAVQRNEIRVDKTSEKPKQEKSKVPPKEQEEKNNSLKNEGLLNLNIADAKKEITQTDDLSQLEEWLKIESSNEPVRKLVVGAINNKVKVLAGK